MRMMRFLFLPAVAFLTFFTATVTGAYETFVVLDDVVFVRTDAKIALPLEKMTIGELQNEYYKMNENFPPHFFYGQNVRGDAEKGVLDAVRIAGMYNDPQKGRIAISGYIDKKKLWREPPLSPSESAHFMTIRDVTVRLLPEKSSRGVLSLLQGEVVEAVGRLQYGGSAWIKAKFENRFGYLEESEILPLIADKLDESRLTLAEVPHTARNLDRVLSGNERERLAQQGFYVEPVPALSSIVVDDMADLYQRIQSPVFLTSDLYLHSFHLIFDRMLQNIERERLYPEMLLLTQKLVAAAASDLRVYRGADEKLKQALTYNLFYFSVAARLLDARYAIPPEVRTDAEAITDRIIKAEGPLPSFKNRIELGREDLTRYRVRGHYEAVPQKDASSERDYSTTEDPTRLERYFRGMMWYGRRHFLLSDDMQTISAILITRALEQAGEFDRWERIDGVLRKLIGKTDDWSPSDFRQVMQKVFGTTKPAINDIVQESALARFRENAKQMLPSARIVDMQTGPISNQQERQKMVSGFRLLGQRFTWDSYVFNQLTYPSVARNLPSASDVMAVLGSSAAEEVVLGSVKDQEWEAAYYAQQKKIKGLIGKGVEKKETSYDSWVHAFSALFLAPESKQYFARGAAWQYKNLNAALGSWSELKHDTILYSKQSGAEQGEGPEFEIPPYTPPYIKGYVEPAPKFFARLKELTGSMLADLQGAGFLTGEYKDKLQTFETLTQQAFTIAKKEVEGSPLTRDDYAWIEKASNSFNRSLLLPRSMGDIINPDLLKMAVIADVATDAAGGRVLEVAVGVPQRLIVVVKDLYGGTRLTTGYVYSWYEFADGKRWTDSEWRAVAYGGDQKKLLNMRPSWYAKLLKPE